MQNLCQNVCHWIWLVFTLSRQNCFTLLAKTQLTNYVTHGNPSLQHVHDSPANEMSTYRKNSPYIPRDNISCTLELITTSGIKDIYNYKATKKFMKSQFRPVVIQELYKKNKLKCNIVSAVQCISVAVNKIPVHLHCFVHRK